MSSLPPRSTKREIIASFPSGWSGTIEKVTAAEKKRVSEAFNYIAGDGTNTVVKVPDPAAEIGSVTISIAVSKVDAFVQEFQTSFYADILDPGQLGALTITSYNDDHSANGLRLQLVNPFIQSIKFPDGDTGSHAEAMAEIVLQAQDILPA
jgi:hypothetical protein